MKRVIHFNTVDLFQNFVDWANEWVWSTPSGLPWLVVALLGTGLLVTTRLALIQMRQLGHAVRVVMGKYDKPDDPGDVSHFAALATALSATVGIGNIAGVALAIHWGGPGAVFWMWVTAFLGMAVKFSECTLAVEYRDFDETGKVAGGPMYYIERGLGKHWKPLAIAFAVCAVVCSMGSGNMNQANTVADVAATEFGVPTWLSGGVLALLVGAVILGGINSISKVASTLVPVMGLLYVMGALIILIMNAGAVPEAFASIFSQAFDPKASLTGATMGTFNVAMLWGVKRGLFSNEAGQGSAPIAHAAAQTDEPVREGAVALLEPMIDTLVICTMTALVIVITGVWDQKREATLGLSDVGIAVPVQVESGVSDVKVGGTIYKDGERFTGSLIYDGAGYLRRPDGSRNFEGFLVKTDDAAAPLVEAAAKPPRLPAEIPVNAGSLGRFRLTGNHALVDDARIVQMVDGKETPFTGALALKGNKLTGPEDVKVVGKVVELGAPLTTWAFAEGLGDWGAHLVTICVLLFALSTAISWSYYGDRCVTYLFGVKFVNVYRGLFVLGVFAGANIKLDIVWAYGDLALGLMTLPNLIAIVLLSPKIVAMSRDYFQRMKEHDAS